MSGGDVAATARLEIRIDAGTKTRLERAAELLKVPVSDFVIDAPTQYNDDYEEPDPALF